MRWSRRTLIVSAALLFAGCGDVPTEVLLSAEDVGPPRRTHDSWYEPSLVNFNNATCYVGVDSPEVACQWNVNNGPSPMTIGTSFSATWTYDCVNPKNGRVSSSGTVSDQMDEWESGFLGGASQGAHWYPLPHVENSLTGKEKKLNACRGGNEVQFTGATLHWWFVQVDNEAESLDDYRYVCVGDGDLASVFFGLHCEASAE